MKCRWQEGNRITLLENGDQYYPALFAAIGRASRRVILESFIWFEDEVGRRLHAVLLEAARRGIQVEVLLDGYGSPDLSDEFVGELTAAGVIFRYYDPRPKLMGMRTNLFRRMHRKIVVIDDTTAFVGGINYSAEHMSDYGPEAKQDYAVKVEGPVVLDILQFELENLPNSETARRGGGGGGAPPRGGGRRHAATLHPPARAWGRPQTVAARTGLFRQQTDGTH
ncbi:cardiolipin synthase ClsB, partial [Klebsiella pneumoniae]